MSDYRAFLEAKMTIAAPEGFTVQPSEVNPLLKPHQRDMVIWMLAGGRRALFASFGLGKTFVQIEVLRLIRERTGLPVLAVVPLGVRQEFRRDAQVLSTGDHPAITDAQRAELAAWQAGRPDRMPSILFLRDAGAIDRGTAGLIHITNYETIRDGKLDPTLFVAASLDEASVLRGFGGTKTFREFMRLFAAIRYKFVATATPDPNEYIELLAYAAFLDIMDVGQAKTRFFRRNSEKADKLTIHPHKEREFWLWVASWALFVQRPSDLGHSDEGYDLPELVVNWHELPSEAATAGADRDGQVRLMPNVAVGLGDAAREKRTSLPARVAKMMELRAEDPGAHRILWHDLEDERRAIEAALAGVPGFAAIWGTQDLEERERRVVDFSDGKLRELAAKPVIAGSGCNFQRHCAWAIFLGIGFKFNDFIQAVHRIQRFLQPRTVRLDLIYTEAERTIRTILEDKWKRHVAQAETMSRIIREFGLAEAAMAGALQRSIGVERRVVEGERYRIVHADTVEETARMASDSVDLIVTSIPFSTQYEYTPSYNDFGHTDDDGHFFRQMDFLTPELLRVLRPGRIAAIHCKDRIVPGGMTGLGFQTVSTFGDDTKRHFIRHGFAYLGTKVIVTDVVRENNQTYRLGWSEQCKDGTRMGFGLPEYLHIFRKPPSDRSNGYADVPVVKPQKWFRDREGLGAAAGGESGYSRARWQLDAHGFGRSSGDRLLDPAELDGIPAAAVYKRWKLFSLNRIYDFDHHVAVGEHRDAKGSLPPTFMLLPPHSWHPDVWTDVARMRTLNAEQVMRRREMHLCPLQFDIVDRAIIQYSMPGETVFDPFMGIGTVPYCAIRLGRRGMGNELSGEYFPDAVAYVTSAGAGAAVPSLFDLLPIAAEQDDNDPLEDFMEAAE